MAGRASVELHTLIFFRGRQVAADARVTKASRCRRGRRNQGLAGWGSGGDVESASLPAPASRPLCSPPLPCTSFELRPPCVPSLPVSALSPPTSPFLPVQVRANGLIVFVPKYGIEGPVYLDDGKPAAEGDGGSSSTAAAADGAYVYDEEKQSVRSADGSVAFTVFDPCAVRIAVEEAAGNRRQLVLRLVPRSELPEAERMH